MHGDRLQKAVGEVLLSKTPADRDTYQHSIRRTWQRPWQRKWIAEIGDTEGKPEVDAKHLVHKKVRRRFTDKHR